MITDDLDIYLNDFGVTVTFGLVSGLGILDMPDDIIGDGMSISTEYSLTVKASVFSVLKRGDAITVDGTAYTVREPTKVDDGKFMRVSLKKT